MEVVALGVTGAGCVLFEVFSGAGTGNVAFPVVLLMFPEILACKPFVVGIGCKDFESGNITLFMVLFYHHDPEFVEWVIIF